MALYNINFSFTSLLFLLFLNCCFSVNTPPRSPSPVLTDLLNFGDDKNDFLLSTHLENAEMQAKEKLHSSTMINASEFTESNQMKPKKKRIMKEQDPLPPGRKRLLSDKERIENNRASMQRWKKRKRKEDPGYVARLSRNRRINLRLAKLTGIEIKAKRGRPAKKFKPNDPSKK